MLRLGYADRGIVTYGPRIFAGPAVDKVQQEIGEFVFENGILLPHEVYLYEFSETGEPYILGKKLPGIDYSATEAGYAKSMGMESQDSWNWSEWFGKSNTATISHFMQPLLWFLFGIFCALVIRWAWPKLAAILSKWKHGDAEDTMSLPTSAIEEEYSKLNNIWRSTLMSMYQEKKSEVENAKAEHAEKVAEQQREIDSLRRMRDTQTVRAQNLESSSHAITAENATANEVIEDQGKRLDTQTARIQTLESSNHAIAAENVTANKTIEDLRQMIDTQTARAQNQESSIHAVAAENATANETIEDLRQRLHTETTRAQDSESTNRRIEAENATALHTIEALRQRLDTETTHAQDSESTNRRIEAENATAKETVKNLRERFEALQSRKEAESDNAKEPLGRGQPESGVVPKEATAGDQDTVGDHPVGKLEGEDGVAEAIRGDGVINNESASPKVGKKGKPVIPRVNTRGDGSIRTPSHPNYVPLEDAPSRLGDRPFRGAGRGSGWNPQRGGGGFFGWRGGRGGRGGGGGGGGREGGGANVRNGQSNSERGQ